MKPDIPPPRARYISKEKNSGRRARYYGKMAKQLREAGVSTASDAALAYRRVARSMKQRHEKFVADGQPTTQPTSVPSIVVGLQA